MTIGEEMNLYGPRQLAGSFRTVRKNTIIIVEDIHEDDYGFRPTSESRSVVQILAHVLFLTRFDRGLHETERVTIRTSPLESSRFRRDWHELEGRISVSEQEKRQGFACKSRFWNHRFR